MNSDVRSLAPISVPAPTARHHRRTLRLAGAMALSASASLLVVASSLATQSRLGAPLYWAWILTGLQVLAMWAAGRQKWWGWLLGACVQPVWIVYAILTGQLGFVPGCLVSAVVQLQNFLSERDASAAARHVLNSDHVAGRPRTHSWRCRFTVRRPCARSHSGNQPRALLDTLVEGAS
ncbi:hypothetical protein [Phytoactinopolyspora halotolerans]|uniref:Uncharacterized protein n=1 Tax=Phytoactinopolyspora halotolerans TaxID=1981512 RepID=A0A6L9SBE3_9ACTN|nr:hypothetical protein [Phytoactinopolyspora halotolerans]NEE01828.1 hypothetical protein [Phytoactinopolyspora halotolerans]